MSKKSLRFNYFTLYLEDENECTVRWDFKSILETIERNRDNDYAFEVGLEQGEIDMNAFHYDDRRLYYFQIAKLRNRNIPDLKKIKVPRRPLELEDNEYISEFLTFIFDVENDVAIIQTNKYSLSTKELEVYLTKLRESIVNDEGNNEIINVKLHVVPDPNKIRQIRNADYIRKIRIKSSQVNLDALVDEESLKEISEVIGQYGGYEFTLEVGLGRSSQRTDSLHKDSVISTVTNVLNRNEVIDGEDKFDLKVSIKDDADTPQEVVNLIEPRMTDVIQIESDNRNDLGAEVIFQTFYEEKYEDRRSSISRHFNLE
ncbi:DUF6731 family protein [Salinicoccus roseus]|uniref:DUF6731 family protein n=1 Tax=Salinicoccus roseus TaxID=45670 RepID=UPI003524C7B4